MSDVILDPMEMAVQLAAARARESAEEWKRLALANADEAASLKAGLEATTGSGPCVEITPEIPKSFYEGLAECRQQMLVDRDQRIAALEAERDVMLHELGQTRALAHGLNRELATAQGHSHGYQHELTAAYQHIAALEEERDRLATALAFYADPDTYFAMTIFADAPAGAFMEDFDEEHGSDYDRPMPGKCARAALEAERDRLAAQLSEKTPENQAIDRAIDRQIAKLEAEQATKP
jgi:hypothetical protein